MKLKIFVSMDAQNRGTVIRLGKNPTSVGELPFPGLYAIGPFRTLRAAEICASGRYPDSVQTVSGFEKMAEQEAK